MLSVLFQTALKKMFPLWEDIKKYEEVVIFTCGLMESPKSLVHHVYELYNQREIIWVRTNTWNKQRERHLKSLGIDITDKHLYATLYAESRVLLLGQPYHNHHINLFSDKENNEIQQITVLSKVYWFTDMKQHLVLNITENINNDTNQDKNQSIKEDIAMLGIDKPDRNLT